MRRDVKAENAPSEFEDATSQFVLRPRPATCRNNAKVRQQVKNNSSSGVRFSGVVPQRNPCPIKNHNCRRATSNGSSFGQENTQFLQVFLQDSCTGGFPSSDLPLSSQNEKENMQKRTGVLLHLHIRVKRELSAAAFPLRGPHLHAWRKRSLMTTNQSR